MKTQSSPMMNSNPALNASWLPSLLARGLASAGEWAQGWYRQARETMRYTLSGPEEPFFANVQENRHFTRFQAWRGGLEKELRKIRIAILSGELNSVELGERLLAVQSPDQMPEHILSPVMYSLQLGQLEKALRMQARAESSAGVHSQKFMLSAHMIQKVLQLLRTNLSTNPELAEEYLASDLLNAVILHSGEQISRDGLCSVLGYYQGLVDDTLWKPLARLIETLPERLTNPDNPFDFAKLNRFIKALLRNIQASFDGYSESLICVYDDNHGADTSGSLSTWLKTAFETARDCTQQGICLARENPKATITATASMATLGAVYYFSDNIGG